MYSIIFAEKIMRALYIIMLAVCFASCGSADEKQDGQEVKNPSAPLEVGPAPTALSDTATMKLPNAGDLAQFAIKEITGFYGGVGTHSNGVTKAGKKFYRVEIRNSPVLDSNVKITELNISNIAMLFYKHLAGERNNFDEIQSAITFGDGQKLVKTYPKERLELVLSKTVVIAKITESLKAKNYAALAGLLNNKSLIVYDKMILIEKIKNAEARLETVKEFIPYGFMFAMSEKKKEILHISGVLLREQGKNNEFSIDFDPSSAKEEALFLNYKL